VVDENFKIRIKAELDQSSLSDLTRQVDKAISQGFKDAQAKVKRSLGALAAPSALPGGAATARSVRSATGVGSGDFTKLVSQLARENKITTSKFDDAASSVVAALNKLTKALEKRPSAGGGGVASAQETARLVARQVGPTNKNLARDIQKSRLEAGRQTTGSGGTSEKRTDLRTGTRKDQPAALRSARERQAARSGSSGAKVHPLQRGAEAQAKAVAASLGMLTKEIRNLGKLSEVPDLLKRIGLPGPGAVGVGPGASTQVKMLTGQSKIVTGSLKIVGNRLTDFSNIVSKRINDLLKAPDFKAQLGRAERASRRGPEGEEKAISILRSQLKGIFDLPSIKHKAAGYEKAGEAVLEIEFGPELQERLSALKDEAAQIALVNKELWEMSDVLKELRKQGAQVVGSVGLGEEEAAKAQIIRGEGKKPIGAQMPVQLRDLAGMVLGGRGAMRAARSFQPYQAREMVEGERPRVMGKGEAAAYEAGMLPEKLTRTLKTAYADPSKVPEIHEDMILLDKKAAEKMAAWEPKVTQALKELAEGIQVGGKLVQDQILGFDIEGKPIQFDLKGAEAEVESIEEVVENGLKGFRVRFKELYEMTTGSKMTTAAGFKGVVRVEEDLTKYGAPKGTEAMISAEGAAKRGVLSDPMKMMAAEISKLSEGEADPQAVANVIEDAMRNGGKDLVQAIEMAAEQFGVKGFTGGRGGMMTGDLPWLRIKEPRAPGAADVGTKYYDKPAVEALRMRADTARMAEEMVQRMQKVIDKQKEYIATLQALAGETDVAAENLREMLPEEFKRLPAGAGAIEDFAGTILDPQFQKAMALRVPERGGAEKLLRLPAMGKALGERGGVETALGAKMPDPLTRMMDNIIQVSRQIRVAEGRAAPDLGTLAESSETFQDAAHNTSRALKDQIAAIYELGIKSEEGAAAAQEFVDKFLPLIDALGVSLTEPIQFYKTQKGERTAGKPVTVARAGAQAAQFIKGRGGVEQQMLAVQDILAGRTARKGKGTENVPTTGEVFQNAQLLQKVMEQLGVTLEQDAAAVDKLYGRLEKLEEGLMGAYAMAGFATASGGKAGSEMKRPLAERFGAGLGLGHKELTAVQMRTDISKELEYVEQAFEMLGDETLDAVARMKQAQGEVAKIPRDVVFLNKQDWDNLIDAIAKEKNIPREEAEARVGRTGLLHRYPTTGGASFLAARARIDPTGTVPAGKVGVPGPFAASSQGDIKTVVETLISFRAELEDVIASEKGVGETADEARSQLASLVPVLQKLNQLYLEAGLNLDFDGDKISWLADTAEGAGSRLETFTQKINKGGVSFQQMMVNMLGKVKGGGAEGFKGYADLLAKTRKIGPKRAILSPETGAMAQAETQAHIGGKKSVGLLTDMFNKMELAVMSGSGEVGDAFATWMDIIMLNINKSLAQKSGAGGTAGPIEFLEDLKGGRLGKIFESMRTAPEGLYAEMGSFNKQMREQMREAFTTSFSLGGPGALKDIASAEGIEGVLPKNITFENFKGAIDSMVNALDLEAVITRMFDMMKKNMARALGNVGFGGGEIQKSIENMLSPGKKGKIPGLDLDVMLGELAPGYLGTRKKQVKELRQEEPMEKAQSMLRLLGRHIAEEADMMIDEFNPEEDFDPRAAARELSDRVKNFYLQIKGSFTTVGRQEDFTKLLKGQYTPKQVSGIGGLFKPGEGGGEIFVSFQKRIRPMLQALKRLNEIAEGSATSSSELKKLAMDIRKFGATVSHEKVHQANKQFSESLQGVVRSLQSNNTAIGREAGKLIEAMSGKANIGKLKSEAERWKKVSEEVGDPQLPELQKSAKKLFNQVGEELLAYQTEPEAFKKMMAGADVSQEAIDELSAAFMNLVTQASTLEESVVSEAAFTRQAASDIKSLANSLEAMGAATGDVRTDIKALGDTLGDSFAGALQSVNEKLTQQEAAVMQGTGMLGLPRLARKGGKLEFTEEVSKTGFEDQFSLISEKVKAVMQAAREGFPDVSVLGNAEREIGEAANDLRAAVSQMEKDKMSGVSRGAGHKLFQKIWQEFHQAVSASYINKARDLQRNIGEMRRTGEAEADPGRLRDLMQELNQVVAEHGEYLARSLKVRGRGRGTLASHIATTGGELVPAAVEAGVKPSAETLQADIASIAGYGKEGAVFMKQMGESIEFATDQARQGKDISAAWSAIFESLAENPEMMHTNIVKVAEILSRISRHLGFMEGKFSDSSTSIMEMVKHAKSLGRALEGKVIKSADDLTSVLQGAPKQAKQAAAAGTGRGSLADSIKQQYKEAEAVAEDYRKRLQELISDPEAFELAGRPKMFEPLTKDIIDPSTGKVIQRVRVEAKRMGKEVVVSMNNASNAAGNFGSQMRSALRRVVQWGFASGVVYGMVRAFRSAVQIITEVQDKMMQLQKVMDTSITNFEAMQDAAIGMAQQFGVAIGDVLDGMVVYGQQGLKMNEILERTEATMLAVNVTTLSSVEATEALTAAHKVFGDSVSASSEFVDAWGAVAAKHAITAKDLADAVKRSGAAADVAGLGFEDFMGLVTAIGAVTRQTGKEIATGTKFMFRAMRRPAAQKELGKINIGSLMPGTGDLRPAMEILQDVAESWSDLSRAQQLNLAQAMAGIRHYNQFIVLMNNFDEALLASADAQNSQGFAMRKNALAMQTFSKQMQVLRETVKKLALELGKAVLPVATSMVKGMSAAIEIINRLPTPIMTAAVAFGALGLAGLKAADLIVDSMDAIFGGGIGEKVKTTGLAKTAFGGVKDIGRGLKTGEIASDFGILGKSAARSRMLVEGFGRGILNAGSAVTGTIPMLGKLSAALKGAGVAARLFAGATGIGLVVLGLWAAYEAYQAFTKTGKDVAKELENQIGRSQDYAMQLKSTVTQIQRASLAFSKMESAMEALGDIEGLREALNSRSYKSAAVAAQQYSDTMHDAAQAIALIDPGRIRGIDEMGGYVVGLSDEFKNLSISAVDAQNAITSALQTKVLTAFAKDIKKPVGFLDKMSDLLGRGIEDLTGGAVKAPDMSPYGKLLQTETELRKLIQQREADAAEGMVARADTEARIVDLTREKAELEEQVLGTSMEIKKVLEAMPSFEDMGMAKTMMGPGMAEAIGAALPSGVFGRGATVSSVMMKQLAKSAGTGGMFDYRAAATPAGMAGGLIERGILPSAGATGINATGEIAVAGPSMAKAIVATVAAGLEGADLMEVQSAAQTLIASVSRETGEDVWSFWDNVRQTWQEVTPEQVDAIIGEVDSELERQGSDMKSVWMRFAKSAMEEAVEETEKILNLAYVGALAGVRMPKGGMPDIGVGRATELSPEQRALKTVALDMERLGEIQNEMNQITKEYSETVLSNPDAAYTGQAKSGSALKALTADMVTLVSQLQEEAFNLSVIGHYQKAIESLGLSMEQAAEAARDARIEEDARSQFLVETSGALKGLSAIPQIDFGKTFKELGASEKLALEVPGFKGFLDQMQRSNRERESLVQQLADVRKQRANFEKVVEDLGAAGEELSGAQQSKILERAAKGIDTGTIESIKAIEEGNQMTHDLLTTQVDLETQMVEGLRDLIKVTAGGEEVQKEVLTKLQRTETSEGALAQLKAYGGAAGASGMNRVTMESFGVQFNKTEDNPMYTMADAVPRFYDKLSEEQRQHFDRLRKEYISVANAGLKIAERERVEAKAGTTLGGQPAWAKMGGENRTFFTSGQVQGAQTEIRDQLLGMAEVAGELSQNILSKVRQPGGGADQDVTGTDYYDKIAQLKEKIKQKEVEAYKKFHEAELKVIAGIEQSTRELLAKEPARLAIAARNFANQLDEMIQGFKKAEMLHYEKLKSDLEGPFARVGQPGFKTAFEQRREALEPGGMRPMSLEQMRQRQKDLSAVEFDEKEARVKQQQDIEVRGLKDQQSQAEQFRSVLADALMGGELEGTGLEGDVKRTIEGLTQELAESEQAYMRGGELFFKGVPSLEDATRMMAKAKDVAKEQAQKAIGAGYKQYITDPLKDALVPRLEESNQHLKSIAATMGGEGGGMGPLPPGAAKGMFASPITKSFTPGQAGVPVVGRTAQNIMQDIIARHKTGNAAASSSSTIDVPGSPTPGSQDFDRERSLRARRAPERAAADAESTEEISSTLKALTAQVEQVVAALGGLGEVGGKIDTATSVLEDIQGGLDVNITGGAVEISNASDIGDAIEGGLSDLGSAVTDGVTRIAALETLVGDEDVETRITAAIDAQSATITSDVATQIEEGQASAIEAAQVAAEEAIQEEIDSLETQLAELQSVQAGLETSNTEQDDLLETVTSAIEATQAELEEIISLAQNASATAIAAGENISTIGESVEEAKVTAEEAKTIAESAEASAATALETANDAAGAVTGFETALQNETTAREIADNEFEAELGRVDAKDQVQDTDITQLKKVASRADENAKRALTGVRRL
jgi:TP901 family phage tail tape measure protein